MALRAILSGVLLLCLSGCSALQSLASTALTDGQQGIGVDSTIQMGGQSNRGEAKLGIGHMGQAQSNRNETDIEQEGTGNSIRTDSGQKKYVLTVEGGQVNIKVDEAPSIELVALRFVCITALLYGALLVYRRNKSKQRSTE